MSHGRRMLSLLLALLLLPGVGALDLCACGPGGHGAFCEDEPVSAASESGGCCASETPAPESAPSQGATHEEGCCDCPVVLLNDSTDKVEAPASDLSCGALVAPLPHPAFYAPPSAAPERPAEVAPRPPPQRLHLLLNVFRC